MKLSKVAALLLTVIASGFISQNLAADDTVQHWTFGPWKSESMISWGSNSLVIDYGINGLWKYDKDGSWIRLSHLNPIDMVALGETDLVVNFGTQGLWKFDRAAWEKIAL